MLELAQLGSRCLLLVSAVGCANTPSPSSIPPSTFGGTAIPRKGEDSTRPPLAPSGRPLQSESVVPAWMRSPLGGFRLPTAINSVPFADAPNVLITQSTILIDGIPVGSARSIDESQRLQKLEDLFDVLKLKREEFKRLHPGVAPPDEVNLWVDSRASSRVVKSVSKTAAFASYVHTYFVVQQRGATPGLGRVSVFVAQDGDPTPGLGGVANAASIPSRDTSVSRLSKEVVQQVVRANFGVFRACYEKGLARNDSLAGKVAVRFVIDQAGHVVTSSDDSSELSDPDVVGCVVRGFRTLRFPASDGGSTTVGYPLWFAPE